MENPEAHEEASKFPNLVKKTKDNNPMKFVIWHAINTDLKANNRHIPVPFDVKALDETVNSFDAISAAKYSYTDLYLDGKDIPVKETVSCLRGARFVYLFL